MKDLRRLIAMILMLVFMLSACASTAPPSTSAPASQKTPEMSNIQSALDFYIECMELGKTDYQKAFLDSSHYEREEHYELARNHPQLLITYEILRIEQLSDELWLVEGFYTSDKIKLGFYDLNYLAKFDGEWKIMMSIEEIPEALKEGIEFEEYNKESPGILAGPITP